MTYLFSRKIQFVVLLCCSIFTGCLREDGGSCAVKRDHADVTLQFRYDYNLARTDLFSAQVNAVDIMIYDAEGMIIETKTVAVNDMDDGNIVSMTLDNGEYTIVAWGNYDDEYFNYEHGESVHASTISVNASHDGSVQIHPASLFHASVEVSVDGENELVPLSMIKNTNHMQIYLMGLDVPSTPWFDPAAGLSVLIEGSNGIYDFRNNLRQCDRLKYQPSYERINENVMLAEMTIMSMSSDDDLTLVITDSNNSRQEYVYNGSLTDVIFQKCDDVLNEDDLVRKDHYELTFLLNYDQGTWILAGIYATDWTGIDEGGDI